jgi:predicted NAD-dependent protein-ADP-ribosyltransferase YbiA (DUF1768 family)
VYFHSQKPDPYNEAEWDSTREAVMEAAIRAKVRANASLAELLLATGDHPLISIKNDQVYGFDPQHGGRNLLAKIWERLRTELIASRPGGGLGYTPLFVDLDTRLW